MNPFNKPVKNVWQDSDEDDDDIDNQFLTGVEKTLKQSVDTTNRALSSIYDSEKIGNETALELARQREKLENVNKKLTVIDENTTSTQTKLNAIGSIWYSIKEASIFKGKNKNIKKCSNIMKNDNLKSEKNINPFEKRSSNTIKINQDTNPFLSTTSKSDSSIKNNFLSQRNTNLEEMHSGVKRLNTLAKNLGDELNAQDKLIDSIHIKSTKQNDKINVQNTKMTQILKK
ncbi:hypothetical protein A3Q56_01498 [Intoshia linei]|uniref:t-SNARE coiled-coil homology domain-containing protein n=1 Tax=Intoshia linei TaxID=1819745 RepID=A0A177B946_9BILA|nr:hypothetical protein A3Q56_01498 [Intoshia linei]